MEEYFIIQTVSKKLKEFKIGELEDLRPSLQSHFVKIESYFQECNVYYKNAVKELEKFDLNTRSICERAGVGKSTVYKYPNTLKKYIEERVMELECNKELVEIRGLKTLEEEVQKQKNLIDKLIIDNIEYMNQKMLIENLQMENERLLKQREIYYREKAQLINKNNELSIELKKLKNNLIKFPHLDRGD